jgi:hypothetical protein
VPGAQHGVFQPPAEARPRQPAGAPESESET